MLLLDGFVALNTYFSLQYSFAAALNKDLQYKYLYILVLQICNIL